MFKSEKTKNSKEGQVFIKFTTNAPDTHYDPDGGCGTSELDIVVTVLEKVNCNRFGENCNVKKKKFTITIGETSNWVDRGTINEELPFNWVGERHKTSEEYSTS